VTLLLGSRYGALSTLGYLRGAEVLAQSLKQHAPTMQRLAMLALDRRRPSDIHSVAARESQAYLASAGWQACAADAVLPDVSLVAASHRRWFGTFTKLRLWSLTQFDRLLL
jgi:alpha-N-acetylglucosamine transferase